MIKKTDWENDAAEILQATSDKRHTRTRTSEPRPDMVKSACFGVDHDNTSRTSARSKQHIVTSAGNEGMVHRPSHRSHCFHEVVAIKVQTEFNFSQLSIQVTLS